MLSYRKMSGTNKTEKNRLPPEGVKNMHKQFQTPTTPRAQVMSHKSHPEKHRDAPRDSRFAFEDDDENIGTWDHVYAETTGRPQTITFSIRYLKSSPDYRNTVHSENRTRRSSDRIKQSSLATFVRCF